jgi:hypothetical protein
MRYGLMAMFVLAVFGGMPALLIVLRPGEGSPIPGVVGLLCLLCLIVALLLSIMGLGRDKRRLLAFVTLLISSAFTTVLLAMPRDVQSFLSALGR